MRLDFEIFSLDIFQLFVYTFLLFQPSPKRRKRSSNSQQSPIKSQALIYKIFNKETESHATCKLCDKTLSTMHGGTTTLRRHASSFHEEIWKQIQACADVNEPEPPSLEVFPTPKNKNDTSIKKEPSNYESNDDNTVNYNSSIPKYYPTYNGQAIIYKLFEKQGEKAQCKICFKVLSALQGSTSTLRRHAARFHTDQWNEILVEAESQPQTTKSTGGATSKRKQKLQNEAIIYKLFVKMGDQAQCKICSKVLSTPQGSTTSIRSHAARFHEKEWQNIQENTDGKMMSENFVKSEEQPDDSEFKSSSTDSHLISYFKTPNKLVVKLESKHDVSEENVENDGTECEIDALDNQDQLISLISEDQNANHNDFHDDIVDDEAPDIPSKMDEQYY